MGPSHLWGWVEVKALASRKGAKEPPARAEQTVRAALAVPLPAPLPRKDVPPAVSVPPALLQA